MKSMKSDVHKVKQNYINKGWMIHKRLVFLTSIWKQLELMKANESYTQQHFKLYCKEVREIYISILHLTKIYVVCPVPTPKYGIYCSRLSCSLSGLY